MQIKITTKELEFAAQKYIKQDFKFDIVDEKTISLSYTPPENVTKNRIVNGLIDIGAKFISVNLSVERIDGSDIYVNCFLDTKFKIFKLNKVVDYIYKVFAESKIPELVSVYNEQLVVHLSKVDSLVKVLDNISLRSVSFSKKETSYARMVKDGYLCPTEIKNPIGIVIANVNLK